LTSVESFNFEDEEVGVPFDLGVSLNKEVEADVGVPKIELLSIFFESMKTEEGAGVPFHLSIFFDSFKTVDGVPKIEVFSSFGLRGDFS
jgi:hypothetical protein